MNNKLKKIVIGVCLVSIVLGVTTFTEVTKAKDDAYNQGTDHQFMYEEEQSEQIITSGPNKYYMIKEGYLYAADKDDMNFKVMCNKPECEHNQSKTQKDKMECEGYFLTSRFLAYYNGNLYVTSRHYVKGEGGGKLELVKLSLDGKKKEVVYTFDKSPTSIAIHRGELYYSIRDDIDSTGSMYRTRHVLNKVKLGDEKATNLYKGNLNREEVIEDITCYGKYIYFTVRSYKDDEITSKQMYYDTVTNTVERIHSDDDRDIVRNVEIAGDKIIYSVCNIISEDDFTYKDYMANLDGSEVEESFTEKIHGAVHGDGENFIVKTVDKETFDATGIQIYSPEGELILDKDTNYFRESSDIDEKEGTPYFEEIQYFKEDSKLIAGDKDYLFILNEVYDRQQILSVDKQKLINDEFKVKRLLNGDNSKDIVVRNELKVASHEVDYKNNEDKTYEDGTAEWEYIVLPVRKTVDCK